jgi:serine/threonine-protein kinase
MLYCCLTGRVPFPEGSAVEKMMAHQTKEPDSILEFAPETPEGLVDVINRLMAKSPDDRFPSCEDVAQILEQYCGELEMSVQASNRQTNSAAKSSFGGSNRGGMLSAQGGGTAVATPAPVTRAPSVARQSLGLGGGGGGMNNHRGSMAGLGGSGGGGASAAVSSTPLPNAPKKTTGLVPSRASFQLPEMDEMGGSFGNPEPTTATGKLSSIVQADPFKDPAKVASRQSNATNSPKQFGTLGMVLASLLLGSLAFLAFKLLTGPGVLGQ